MSEYSKLCELIGNKPLPLMAENENGETVIVEGNASCIRTTILQSNDWCRVNEYYPDGIITETYER